MRFGCWLRSFIRAQALWANTWCTPPLRTSVLAGPIAKVPTEHDFRLTADSSWSLAAACTHNTHAPRNERTNASGALQEESEISHAVYADVVRNRGHRQTAGPKAHVRGRDTRDPPLPHRCTAVHRPPPAPTVHHPKQLAVLARCQRPCSLGLPGICLFFFPSVRLAIPCAAAGRTPEEPKAGIWSLWPPGPPAPKRPMSHALTHR
ncbi:hypothetical protein M432DRAFT_355337 [Thermoascus aurantiacus ATCC 26904]